LILIGSLVLGTHVDDTVRINVKSNFDLRDTTGCGRKTEELEVSEHFVVLDEFSFALEDLDFNGSLTVCSGGEDLGFLSRDGGVAIDETGEDTAEGLDTKGEGCDIKKEDVGDVSGQDRTLNGGTDGDSFIRIYGFGGLLLKDLLDAFNYSDRLA